MTYRIYDKERGIYMPLVWRSLDKLVYDVNLGLFDEVPCGRYVVESVELERSMPLELLWKRGKACNIGEQ